MQIREISIIQEAMVLTGNTVVPVIEQSDHSVGVHAFTCILSKQKKNIIKDLSSNIDGKIPTNSKSLKLATIFFAYAAAPFSKASTRSGLVSVNFALTAFMYPCKKAAG